MFYNVFLKCPDHKNDTLFLQMLIQIRYFRLSLAVELHEVDLEDLEDQVNNKAEDSPEGSLSSLDRIIIKIWHLGTKGSKCHFIRPFISKVNSLTCVYHQLIVCPPTSHSCTVAITRNILDKHVSFQFALLLLKMERLWWTEYGIKPLSLNHPQSCSFYQQLF